MQRATSFTLIVMNLWAAGAELPQASEAAMHIDELSVLQVHSPQVAPNLLEQQTKACTAKFHKGKCCKSGTEPWEAGGTVSCCMVGTNFYEKLDGDGVCCKPALYDPVNQTCNDDPEACKPELYDHSTQTCSDDPAACEGDYQSGKCCEKGKFFTFTTKAGKTDVCCKEGTELVGDGVCCKKELYDKVAKTCNDDPATCKGEYRSGKCCEQGSFHTFPTKAGDTDVCCKKGTAFFKPAEVDGKLVGDMCCKPELYDHLTMKCNDDKEACLACCEPELYDSQTGACKYLEECPGRAQIYDPSAKKCIDDPAACATMKGSYYRGKCCEKGTIPHPTPTGDTAVCCKEGDVPHPVGDTAVCCKLGLHFFRTAEAGGVCCDLGTKTCEAAQ